MLDRVRAFLASAPGQAASALVAFAAACVAVAVASGCGHGSAPEDAPPPEIVGWPAAPSADDPELAPSAFEPEARLFVIELAAGDVPGFAIDFPSWSGHVRKYQSASWLTLDEDRDGTPDYDGVLFRGKGRGVTHIRPGQAEATILVGRNPGITAIEGATIHCGRSQGIFHGLEQPGRALEPEFELRLINSEVLSDQPTSTATLTGRGERGPPESDARSWRLWEIARGFPLESPGPTRARIAELGRADTSEQDVGVVNAYRTWLHDPRGSGAARFAAETSISTKWGIFCYQSDVWLRDSRIDVRYAAEHAEYVHGFAQDGILWERCSVTASSAEGCKITARPWEAHWVATAKVRLIDCTLRSWYFSTRSWRGGGGVVGQGGGVDLWITRCLFWNPGPSGGIPSQQRTRALMVDDGADNDGDGRMDFYDAVTGAVGTGFANGRIIIRDSGFYVGPGTSDYANPVTRIGNLQQRGHKIARLVSITGCGFYGQYLPIRVADVPTGKLTIAGCNTDQIDAIARSVGIPTNAEAVIPTATTLIPVSQGFSR